jgi:N-acetylmuramoyl-L-alanine amidase
LRHLYLASRGFAAALAILATACAPVSAPPAAPAPEVGLPPIPAVDGPLAIRVVHPTPSTPRPNVDSTLIYGSVGTGTASLRVNGQPVTVEPNGAFLAFLPTPPDGTYNLTAEARGRTVTETRSYRAPPTAAVTPSPAAGLVEFAEPRAGVISGGSDTLRTGSDVAIGRTSPTGTFRWFLPRGARVVATGQQGQMVRVRLDTATAWFPAADLNLQEGAAATGRTPLAGARVIPAGEWIDVRIPAGGAPFHIRPEAERLVLTIYGRTPPAGEQPSNDPLLSPVSWRDTGSAEAEIRLTRPLWGYKAFYSGDGDLVVRVRRPPAIDPARPLNGIRVVVDPGHPPAGATGPTGLTEAEANLSISLRLAEMLRARGAEVVMTRSTGEPLVSATDQAAELRARTQLAVDVDAHLFVSVHNNAFPEGVDPFRSHGTSTYHFHPFAAELARLLNEEIVRETRIRDLRHRQGNLAVVRPTWFPAALTESVFMPIPAQEAALRNPGFVERLAAAHVAGLERFLRSQAR